MAEAPSISPLPSESPTPPQSSSVVEPSSERSNPDASEMMYIPGLGMRPRDRFGFPKEIILSPTLQFLQNAVALRDATLTKDDAHYLEASLTDQESIFSKDGKEISDHTLSLLSNLPPHKRSTVFAVAYCSDWVARASKREIDDLTKGQISFGTDYIRPVLVEAALRLPPSTEPPILVEGKLGVELTDEAMARLAKLSPSDRNKTLSAAYADYWLKKKK